MEEGRYFYSKEEYQKYLDKEYNTKMDESQSYDKFKSKMTYERYPFKCCQCVYAIPVSLTFCLCYAPGKVCRPKYPDFGCDSL